MRTVTRTLCLGVCTLLGACYTQAPTENTAKVGEVNAALVVDCPYLDPTMAATWPPPPVAVDFDKEIEIRDLSVVEDVCRTSWTPPMGLCAPATVGAWTFLNLMTQMAGTVPVQQFVQDWLHTFEVVQTVNGFAYPARSNFRAAFLDPWVIASGCMPGAPIVGPMACNLNLTNPPIRLLAIVNRMDLSGKVGAPPGMGYDSGPGEGRFVFGFLDSGNSGGNPLPGTLIMEYEVPPFQNAFGWESDWHQLSGLAMGSPAYLTQLQHITDNFITAGLTPGNPNNGVSIGQVRTNEIAFGPGWQLREFTLQNNGGGVNAEELQNDTTKGSPDDSLNPSALLDQWLIANEPAILAQRFSVPTTFLGSPFLGGQAGTPILWNTTGPGMINWKTRQYFGLGTCGECHNAATNNIGFTHVNTRFAGVMATLSPFLSQAAVGTGINGLPAASQTFPEPVSGNTVSYNEPWRRMCELTRLLDLDPAPYTHMNGGH